MWRSKLGHFHIYSYAFPHWAYPACETPAWSRQHPLTGSRLFRGLAPQLFWQWECRFLAFVLFLCHYVVPCCDMWPSDNLPNSLKVIFLCQKKLITWCIKPQPKNAGVKNWFVSSLQQVSTRVQCHKTFNYRILLLLHGFTNILCYETILFQYLRWNCSKLLCYCFVILAPFLCQT